MSDKEKKQLALTGGLILVMVFFMVNMVNDLGKRGKKRAERQAQKKEAAVNPAKAADSSGSVSKVSSEKLFNLENISRASAIKRDPFMPVSTRGGQIRFTGVIWDSQEPQAIINDVFVKVGGNIGDGVTVVEIRKNSVILSDGSENIELFLEE